LKRVAGGKDRVRRSQALVLDEDLVRLARGAREFRHLLHAGPDDHGDSGVVLRPPRR
jgi:hypothetical protein